MTPPARVFLYGTLRDPDLLEIVSGARIATERAVLPDHEALAVDGGAYPLIRSEPGRRAEGLLIDVGGTPLERLDFYETGFGYVRRGVSVEADGGRLDADVWFPPEGLSGEGPWRLDDWQAQFAPLVRETAREYLRLFGRRAPEEAARHWDAIRPRAFSRLRAKRDPSPTGPGPEMSVKGLHLASDDQPYMAFFALREDRLRFPMFGGGRSEEVTRISFVAADAVTVLPYDPVRDSVLLLRQFRHGPFVRDDANPWTLEPVAGRIDPDETPEETARREMREETGIEVGRLEFMSAYYPSPGAFSEHVVSYLGLADLDGLDGEVRGLESEAEDIMLHVVGFEDLMGMIASGVANTGTLVLSALWLARERERIRESGFS